MTTYVTEGRRSFVVLFAVLAMIAALLAIPATPVNAAPTAACPATIPSAGFTDLAGLSTETVESVNCIAFYDITKGTSATTYGPTANVTRWQMALFLTRQATAHGVTLPDPPVSAGYTDLTGLSADAVKAINQLAELGITKGTSATTYSPNDNVTRWQMALFLARLVTAAGVALPDPPADAGFTDLTGLSADAVKAINQLAAAGIAKGTSATTYSPNAVVLRWQMALFLARTLEAGGVTPTDLPTTEAIGVPQLTKATVDVTQGGETRLLLEFDENIGSTVDDTEIWLATWWGDLINPTSAAKGSADAVVEAVWDADDVENAVAVIVTGSGDIDNAVDFGAVLDVSGNYNVTGSVPFNAVTVNALDYMEAGVSAGGDGHPELASIGGFSDSADTIEFTFDMDVEDGTLSAAADMILVVFDDGSSQGNDAASIVATGTADDETVKAKFTGLSTSDFNSIERVFLMPGAVADDDTDLNPPMVLDVGGSTSAPDLSSVSIDSDSTTKQATFVFDEVMADFPDVADNTEAADNLFWLVLADGTWINSVDANRDDANPTEIDVEFGGVLDTDAILYAVVTESADVANNLESFGDGDENAYDGVKFSHSFAKGETVGPELVTTSGSRTGLSGEKYTLEFEFDEDLADPTGFALGDFIGYDADGNEIDLGTAAGGVTDDDGDEILKVTYDAANGGAEEDAFDALDGGDVILIVIDPAAGDVHGQTSYPDAIGCGC